MSALVGSEAPLPDDGVKDRHVDHLDDRDGAGIVLLDELDKICCAERLALI